MRYEDYKKVDLPWLEEVPSHWDIKRIASVFEIRKEKNDPIKTDEILSLSAKYGVTPYSKKKEKGGNKPKSDLTKYNICREGDILVNCMNIVAGAVGISKYFGAVSPVYYPLITNSDNNKYFMEYIFRNYDFQRGMVGLGKGIMMNESDSGNLTTVRMRISWDTLKTLEIPIPPNEEQEQIARFLDWKINEIDRLMEIENEKIKVIKKSIKSVHQDLILGKLKNKSMNFTNKKFVDGIPSNWKVVKLKKILEKIEVDANKDDEIVICSNHGHSFYRGDRKIGLSSEDNRYYQRVEKNQIMIHGMDTWHGAICISNHFGKCTRVVHVCKSQENDEYIVYYLRLLAFIGMYKPYSNGVRQNTSDFRSWNVLGNIDILLPPKKEQDSIVVELNKYIKTSNQTIKISEGRIKNLQLLKQSIISDFVTGKVDIRNLEIPNYEISENNNWKDENEEYLENLNEEV